jgi:hypothetical protein
MSKDPASRREERIKELLAWARQRRLDPSAIGTFDKLERRARDFYLVTSFTARDYAKLVLQLLRDDSALVTQPNVLFQADRSGLD